MHPVMLTKIMVEKAPNCVCVRVHTTVNVVSFHKLATTLKRKYKYDQSCTLDYFAYTVYFFFILSSALILVHPQLSNIYIIFCSLYTRIYVKGSTGE
jgi:hypothetical protein